jgi:histone H3/H4
MNNDGHDPAPHDAAQSEGTEPATPLDAMWAASLRDIDAVDPRKFLWVVVSRCRWASAVCTSSCGIGCLASHALYAIGRFVRIETENWKIQTLPLARVKKIMKSEEFITHELERERLPRSDQKPPTKFMIASDAPLLMSKACELLIRELSVRAWQHTERNRRRTLQRQDVHAAVGESEVFDFLVDIVPRVAAHSSRQPAEFPVSLPMSMPGVQGVHQAHAFAQAPITHPTGHDFDPMHGQFAYFNPLTIPGMEGTDVPQIGASGMTFPAQQQHVQAQHSQQPASSAPQGHEQHHYSQQQEQQQQQQQQQLDQQQEPSLPQWTDPPV